MQNTVTLSEPSNWKVKNSFFNQRSRSHLSNNRLLSAPSDFVEDSVINSFSKCNSTSLLKNAIKNDTPIKLIDSLDYLLVGFSPTKSETQQFEQLPPLDFTDSLDKLVQTTSPLTTSGITTRENSRLFQTPVPDSNVNNFNKECVSDTQSTPKEVVETRRGRTFSRRADTTIPGHRNMSALSELSVNTESQSRFFQPASSRIHCNSEESLLSAEFSAFSIQTLDDMSI